MSKFWPIFDIVMSHKKNYCILLHLLMLCWACAFEAMPNAAASVTRCACASAARCAAACFAFSARYDRAYATHPHFCVRSEVNNFE